MEREHIPPKHPLAWRPIWHPKKTHLFNYHPSRGPWQTLRQQTTLNCGHTPSSRGQRRQGTIASRTAPGPPLLFAHASIKRRARKKTDGCAGEHKHWQAHLVSSDTVSRQRFQPGVKAFSFNRALWFVGKANLIDWRFSSQNYCCSHCEKNICINCLDLNQGKWADVKSRQKNK